MPAFTKNSAKTDKRDLKQAEVRWKQMQQRLSLGRQAIQRKIIQVREYRVDARQDRAVQGSQFGHSAAEAPGVPLILGR